MRRLILLTLLLGLPFLFPTVALAQTDSTDSNETTDVEAALGASDQNLTTPTRRWYLGNSFDAAILSTAIFEKPGERRQFTTPRFTFTNFGYHFNYDFDKHFGIFTGLGIKNIGFIEKDGDSTIKRRVYTIGMPFGWKLGNLIRRHYVFFGGGFDVPFNYREKGFVKRSDKDKFNEWFSDRTPRFMPYVFLGAAFGSGTTLKLQYYTGNFFNQDYEETQNGYKVRPYQGYRANLLYLTLGLDLQYKKHEKKAEDTTPKVM